MKKNSSDDLSAIKLFESLDVGGRKEDSRTINYLRREQAVFKKIFPDRHIVVMKSKFKEDINIIMRAE